MKYSEFERPNFTAWREKALTEIKDKKFEEVLSKMIGKQINIEAYAEAYLHSTEELRLIQQAQKKELGWKFENGEDLQTSRNKEAIISSEINEDIISEISELIFKVQQHHKQECFVVEIGLTPDYLLTISKIRAIRFLTIRVLNAYESTSDFSLRGITDASFYKSDNEHINIVRAATMAMSGVIGGCDTLNIVPFDKADNGFSVRIAKNISHILAEEAYLNEVNDPAAGSYFIENLTYELIQKSWESFIQKMK